MDREKRPSSASIIIAIILLASAVILSAAARMVPGFAQWYSTVVYPLLQGTLGRLCGLAPFSVAEVLCFLLPVLLIADIIICFRKSVIHRSDNSVDVRPGSPLLRILKHIFIAACILIFMYTANCGVNYYRDPFVDPESYAKAEFTEDELTAFCEFTTDQISRIYGRSDTDTEYPEKDLLAHAAIEAMSRMDDARLQGFYPRPKQLTALSRLFSSMGVTGIYSPFTIEANINGEMTGLEKPFTACHELSHLRGFMNEGEANYIGWLACIGSEEPSFNRSGWLIAWIYAGNSLYRTDPDKYYEIREKLPAKAIRELDENTEFWAAHETRASEVQDRVNDAYLKSNGLEDGVQSYGQLTTLMLMWYSLNQ